MIRLVLLLCLMGMIVGVADAKRHSKQEMHRIVAIAWEKEQPNQEKWQYPQDAYALIHLSFRESSHRSSARNTRSSAYGLFQFLNGTWRGTGFKKTSDPVIQTRAAIRYISLRYGDAESALNFQRRRGWY